MERTNLYSDLRMHARVRVCPPPPKHTKQGWGGRQDDDDDDDDEDTLKLQSEKGGKA